ncbi:DUF3239 domain-containing protein [Corynebacterium sp. sy017]|uniref:DUF3239 domain-containing protein n=1 Tax=unclassified Corynebacterium TaxID=2624378 RepID=UPI0011856D40|nr:MULTISPECIES: DUF3239 domain-containing protein [unclassified Corynebacterium]MBP3088786.1 DUF3239 domain-containing protein [Corynebacterium sp. sy017]QDZ42180.1 DUF3239 domain-containing protein [Corynebacterium sp. sy039]TSD91129.1 DUF3239 domain-containing protein [Corynebacterium sp. SY003]
MSTFHFDIDTAHAKKNNEILKDTRRLQISAFIFALIQLGIGIALYFYLNKDIMGLFVLGAFGAMAVFTLAFIFIIPRKVGTPQQLYQKYELAPAIIAQVNPRDMVLLALVNTNVDPDISPRWALAARTVTALPGHNLKVGEQVPSVAVTGRRSLKTEHSWDHITPMPIAWATKDAEVIQRAKKEIPQQLWAKLEKNLPKLAQVRETKFDLLSID